MEIIDIWEIVDSGHMPEPPLKDWRLYYDETNNCRKFKINLEKPYGYNCERGLTHDFILGGVALRPDQNPDVEELIRLLGLESCAELKSKHLLKGGDFIYKMGSDRVLIFLRWMVENDILVHYFTTNNLYNSIIDLVDESYTDENAKILLPFHSMVKEELYYFVMKNSEEITEILHRSGFPNIDASNVNAFCNDISEFIKTHGTSDDLDAFFLEIFRQNIKALSKNEQFIFLNNGEKGTLINDYSSAYWFSMMNAPNAFHFFDHEQTIVERFKEYQLIGRGAPYDRYSFIDSKEDRYIQISDVFVKILGDCFHYIDSMGFYEKDKQPLLAYNPRVVESFHLLNQIISKSEFHHEAIFLSMCPRKIRDSRYAFLERFDTLYKQNIITTE